MTIKPLPKQVLIKYVALPKKTTGGIYLPNEEAEQVPKIEALGEGCQPMLKKGQRVILQKFQGDEIKDGDTKYIIVSEVAILGIIEEVSKNG